MVRKQKNARKLEDKNGKIILFCILASNTYHDYLIVKCRIDYYNKITIL